MTTQQITICNTVNGRIKGYATLSPFTSTPIPEDHITVDGLYEPSQYYYDINDGQIKPRTDPPLSWDTTTPASGETATLSGLPIPCTVSVQTIGDVVVNDGTLEITFTDFGTYKVVFDEVEYIRYVFQIEVT